MRIAPSSDSRKPMSFCQSRATRSPARTPSLSRTFASRLQRSLSPPNVTTRSPCKSAGASGVRRKGTSKICPRFSGSILDCRIDDHLAEYLAVLERHLAFSGLFERQNAIDHGNELPREREIQHSRQL